MGILEDCMSYVIHLDIPKCKNRRSFFMKNLTNAGFKKIKVLNAVHIKNKHDIEEVKKTYNVKNLHSNTTNSEFGCLFSHMKAWTKLLDTDDKYAIIFEDDIFFHPKWKSIWSDYWNNTPKDFDLLFMGLETCKPKDEVKNLDKIFTLPCLCTHSYIISRTGAKKLLSLFKKKSEESELHSIDNVIRGFMYETLHSDNKILKWYCWNGRKYPCIESENNLKGRNDGLVFQSDSFPGTIERWH